MERSADGVDEVRSVDGEGLRAVDGRVPGRRGQATRQRLLDTTLAMLTAGTYRDLRVVDIARAAGTSPATFYQYFPDVPAAVLVLARELADAGYDALSAPVVEGDVSTLRRGSDDGPDLADRVAASFVDFWAENQALIRVVDLAALEGDTEFRAARTRLLNGVYEALRSSIEQRRRAGAPGAGDPAAMAGVLTSMLSHVAAHVDGFAAQGVEPAELRAAMALVIRTALGPTL